MKEKNEPLGSLFISPSIALCATAQLAGHVSVIHCRRAMRARTITLTPHFPRFAIMV